MDFVFSRFESIQPPPSPSSGQARGDCRSVESPAKFYTPTAPSATRKRRARASGIVADQQIADHRHRRRAGRDHAGAVASVMPPMATSGTPRPRPRGPRRAARRGRRREPSPWSWWRRPGRGDVAHRRAQRLRQSAPACASSSPTSAVGPEQPPRTSGGRSSWPTCTPVARRQPATSTRSLTIDRRRRAGRAAPRPRSTSASRSRAGQRLGAQLEQARRRRRGNAAATSSGARPARAQTSTSTMA